MLYQRAALGLQTAASHQHEGNLLCPIPNDEFVREDSNFDDEDQTNNVSVALEASAGNGEMWNSQLKPIVPHSRPESNLSTQSTPKSGTDKRDDSYLWDNHGDVGQVIHPDEYVIVDETPKEHTLTSLGERMFLSHSITDNAKKTNVPNINN